MLRLIDLLYLEVDDQKKKNDFKKKNRFMISSDEKGYDS
jgi:hypothetical protein